MEEPHGSFVYYYQSGQIESQGDFRDGEKVGVWQRFDRNGNEKPEKVYAVLPMLKAIEKAKKE
jgi:antitoxin component YwqK of YwqJK toxin-antitoxin module